MKTAMTSKWLPTINKPQPNAGTNTTPTKGYQVGWPQNRYAVTSLNSKDSQTLSAQYSPYNIPYTDPALIGQNSQANWYNRGGVGSMQGPQDIARSSSATVGGSINGMQNGAGLQVTANGQTVAIQPANLPTVPPPYTSRLANTGIRASHSPQITADTSKTTRNRFEPRKAVTNGTIKE